MTKQEKKEYMKKYYEEHKEIMKLCSKKYVETHKEEKQIYNKEYKKIYQQEHKEELKKKKHESYLKNKEQIKIAHREYYLKNKEASNARSKKYYEEHKEEMIQACKENHKKRVKKDISYKILHYLRARIYNSIRYNYKSSHTLELLGCSIEFLKLHLENQFKEGMSWSNYGEWHIDHIRPCASFDMSISEQQKLCFNYNNLQPLWAEENLHKHASLVS